MPNNTSQNDMTEPQPELSRESSPKIKELTQKICSIWDEVSTPPNRTSFYWKDSFSVLSWTILHVVYLERGLSLLQWIKYLYRHRHRDSKDPASKRPNVPASVVEYYYLGMLAIMLAIVFSFSSGVFPYWTKVISWYFIIDSTFWVLYYFFFRRFFEEKYAIMHTLEYIVLFPVVLVIQACGIHVLMPEKGISAYLAMLINPNTGTPILILLLSVVYVAVIFGLIISNIPMEKVKEKGEFQFHLLVIGYGDVVRNRLKPTLKSFVKSQEKPEYLNVAYYALRDTIPDEAHEHEGRYFESRFPLIPDSKSNQDDFHKDVLRSNILWIATPPFAHFQYLDKYRNEGKFIVLEKPITVFRKEYELIKEMRKSHWNNIFLLSYYLLEKALPLTFLYRPLSCYVQFLDFHGRDRDDILQHFALLGSLRQVDINIIEQEDTRNWAFDQAYGGQLFETFIHHLSLTCLVLGHIPPLSSGSLKNDGKEILFDGIDEGCKYRLHLKKNTEEKIQKAVFTYDNGHIQMNMNTEEKNLSLFLSNPNRSNYTLSIKENYRGESNPYAVQWNLVRLCHEQGIIPSEVDCSDIQFDCLDWLFG